MSTDVAEVVNVKAEQTRERIAALRLRGNIPRTERKAGQIPSWVYLAIALHDAEGHSWAAAAKRQGKSKAVLEQYVRSPGAKAYRSKLKEIINDPVRVGRIALEAGAVGWAVEGKMLYEAAKSSGNLAEAGKMWRSVAEGIRLLEPQAADAAPLQVIVNMQGGQSFSADAPMGEATYEVVQAEIIRDEA